MFMHIAHRSQQLRAAVAGVALATSLLTVSAVAAPTATAGDEPAVIPRLSSWEPGRGAVTLDGDTRILIDAGSAGRWTTGATQPGLARRTAGSVARTFSDELAEIANLRPRVSADVHRADDDDIVLRLVEDEPLGAEGYDLTIGDGPVRLTANTSTGLYYATRTLEQLLSTAPDRRTLPAGHTRDTPDQRIRQVMLDAGRKYWEPEYLENLIRQMSWNKMNTLFLHLSEAEGFRLDSPRFPGLADPDVSYDRQEIARLKRFAARHHVMLVPGIDVPGHATVISEHFGIGFGSGPDACTSEHMHSHLTPDWALDITDERTSEVTAALLQEFLPWFDAPYVHIGADELPGQLAGCPRVQDHLADDPDVATLGDLLTRYINETAEVAAAHGSRTIIYNGVEHMDSPQQDVDGDVVFMTWTGSGTVPEIPGHDEIATGPFYMTPNNYHSRYPDESWMYDEWEPSTAGDMLGSSVMNWADYNFWSDDQYFEQLMATPRAILADRTWNASPTPDTVEGFRARLDAVGAPPGFRPPASPPRVDDGEPSHHWPFDDAAYPSGWTYAGSPGNTIITEDLAGERPGTSYIVNNPELIPDGVDGDAWRFDHDRDGVGFGGLDVAPPWTVSAWVRRSGSTGDAPLLSSKHTAIKLEQYRTCARVGFTEKGVADHSFDYSTPVDEWVHLTLVAQPGNTALYVNGELTDTVDAVVDLPMRSVGDVGSSIRGDLDELKVYDEALPGEDVRAAYDSYDVAGSAEQAPCLQNVAVGADAEQSSTAYGGVAARAVDGNTSGSFGSGSVTHTAEDGSPEPYWQVDLGESYTPEQIAVWNRSDCCAARLSDYYVFLSEEPFERASLAGTVAQPGVVAFHQTGTAGRPTTIDADGASGRYVRVQPAGDAPLSLAEVQVLLPD